MGRWNKVLLGVIVGATALALATTPWSRDGQESIDERALALVDQAADLCPAYDFQRKGIMAGQRFRPVACKGLGGTKVSFTLNVYPSDAALRADVGDAYRARMPLFLLIGDDWMVEAFDESLVRRLQDRLGGRLLAIP